MDSEHPTPDTLRPKQDSEHPTGNTLRPTPHSLHPDQKPRLLIVEDNEILSKQMKWALDPDYEVFVARDRPSAVEIVKTEKPAVVTLDLGLPPDPDGVEEDFSPSPIFLSRSVGSKSSSSQVKGRGRTL